MKTTNYPEDDKLPALLRGARPTPELPPRFEENVWRRIETGEMTAKRVEPDWFSGLAAWLLKPKFAAALVAMVVLAGVGLGWNSAQRRIHLEAQARYLAAVAPNSLR